MVAFTSYMCLGFVWWGGGGGGGLPWGGGRGFDLD